MARTKHRKDHTKALAHRRLMQALERQELPPHPVKVGKNKFKVLGDGPGKPTTPEEIAALPEIQINGTSGPTAPGDVVFVHGADGRPFYARVGASKEIRGRTSNFLAIDDASNYPKAFVDGQEVPSKPTATGRVILDEAPPKGSTVVLNTEIDYKQLEERVAAQLCLPLEALQGRLEGMSITPEQERSIREGKFGRYYSMGCSTSEATCSICGKTAADGCEHLVREIQGLDPAPLPGICGPFEGTARLVALTPRAKDFQESCEAQGVTARAHLELGWHRDADGKPVFDEISLCPGPDPNGLTDLK